MTSSANSPTFSAQDRPKLRQATLILPTGERVKRNVTFGRSPGLNGANSDGPTDERSPLLGRQTWHKWEEKSLSRKVIDITKEKTRELWTFTKSKTGRGVFKCSIAYLLGSMATFVPAIANLLGQQDGKHMVATVTVYYHPARSIGSMLEASICAAGAFLYAVFISFSSMGVSMFFGKTLDLVVLGHILVLILFCGAGLGFVGWIKQRLNHPLVNISCSLTSLAIITVLTKEGAVQAAAFSDDKITQVMLMILMGVVATTAVATLISPVSARKELRSELVQVTESLGGLLTMITQAFLAGSEEELQQQAYSSAMDKYKKVLISMTRNLKEAKYEHYVMGTEKEYHLEAKIVKCMQRLGQNTGGLRSAATTQFLLLAQPNVTGQQSYYSNKSLKPVLPSFSSISTSGLSPVEGHAVLASIDETPEEASSEISTPARFDTLRHPFSDETGNSSLAFINSPSDIFTIFIMQLGPSMKSLAITMANILDGLPYNSEGRITVDTHFGFSLDEAIRLYSRSRKEALELLYKDKDLTQSKPPEMEADFEEVAASCGYFSFSLLNFANEMKKYLEILDDLQLEVEERPCGRTWSWLKFWPPSSKPKGTPADTEQVRFIDAVHETGVPEDVPSPTERKAASVYNYNKETFIQSYRYRLWQGLGFLRRDDIKFAIKVGVGAALYALPSFLANTRPFYQRWRGEWGLLSYMLVCAMTLGASNTTGFARFLGTCIGAVCAIVAWIASQGSAYLLAFFGWLMSLWTAYIIVAQGKGPMGRFIMLTYNLSALYAYSLSVKDVDDDKDEGGFNPIITEIALHRVVAVLSGCLWGLIVTRIIWPISARQKFKDGLSLLWLRMGLIWKRDPLNMLLDGASPYAYMDLREEFDLHRFLTRLENLRSAAASEVDLRGPFPDASYSEILRRTGAMLDAFHAMNVMLLKDPRASKGEAEILKYTANERAALCSRISHLFQVLASSMKLEFPMNSALPNIEHTRDRLLAKMFRFRQEGKDRMIATDEDFALFYAYANPILVLVTGQLSNEIKEMGKEIERLFGILNEDLLKLQ
ncbi:MAG: hypothetical protein Q9217_005080 [Psora testacea]